MLTRKIYTAPAVEPITVTEAKEHCRVDHAEHDAILFPRLIAAAREYVEDVTSRRLITQVWDVYLDCFPYWAHLKLPFGALQAVGTFEWTDSAGATSSWTYSSGNLVAGSTVMAHVDIINDPGLIRLAYGQYWPTVTLKTSNPIHVRFTCGYGADGSYVPASLRSAMLLLIDHWLRNTSAVTTAQAQGSVDSKPLAMAVDSLIANYRLY